MAEQRVMSIFKFLFDKFQKQNNIFIIMAFMIEIAASSAAADSSQ